MGKHKYAILILAAGNSTRLGRPKQLVKWNNTTLLNHTIEQAIGIKNTDTYLALGGNQIDIRPSISSEIPILDIPNWREGMGSTIASSLSQIKIENYKAIILSVCDQPFISTGVFTNLIEAFETENCTIVISKYRHSSGPPTLFDKVYFQQLLALNGDNGAKDIVQRNFSEVAKIQFEQGDLDIDTEIDLVNLLEKRKQKD